MSKTKKKLGQLLLDAGLIDDLQLRSALSYQSEWGGRLGAILIRKGFVKESDMISVIEKQMGMSCIPLEEFEKPDDELLDFVKENIARKFGILPLRRDGKTLIVATSDPTDLKTLDDLSFLLGTRIRAVLALESDILTAVDHFYDPLSTSGKMFRQNRDLAGQPRATDSGFEIIRSLRDAEISTSAETGTADDSIDHQTLKGIIDLLVEKGVITREELSEKMKRSK